MTPYRWTKPYYGVPHLEGLKHGYQITIIENGSLIEATVLHRHSDKPFTPVAEKTFESVYDAKTWCEDRHEAKE